MKYRRIFQALTIGVILSLLVVVIPASPALAAREIDLEKDEGEIGEYIDFDGEGWPPSDPAAEPPFYKYVDIYFTSEEASVGEDIDDEINVYELVEDKIQVDTDGDISGRFKVPSELSDGSPDEDVRGGTYYVCATYWNDEDIKAVAEFTILAGEITDFDPDEGPVGTEVDISGEDFAENEELTIEYDGDELDDEYLGDCDDTDNQGDFDCTIIIPPSTAGDHTVTIGDGSLSEVEETFTVEPEMSFTPILAPPGDTVEVTGTGFGDRADVDIFLNAQVVATKQAGRDGSFTVGFIVPEMEEGTYDLVAEDEDGNEVEASFTVEKGIEATVSPVTSASSPGHVGDSVIVGGVGFLANSAITITYATEPQVVATTTSDADGAFSATFDIPASEPGAHTLTASDGTNSLQVSFYMESQAPPIPAPLLPLMNDKAASQTYFDWENVTDPSGVTYDLQIAIDEEFTTSAMVLEKTGLTESEYTLTKEEALESRSEEEPYHWRVRATDGASNASAWTGTGEFSVGFAWPDWIIHLWWGLGVLGIGFLGYYLGKRRAYYY